MSTGRLIEQIRKGQTDAVATARDLGPAAMPALRTLVSDPDPEVRLGAVRCLDGLGGPEAQSIAIRTLDDQDAQVAGRAAVLLSNHPPKGRAPELLAAFNRIRDDEVRPLIALAGGRIEGADPAPWVAAMRPRNSENVNDALLIAAARMGHAPSREAFLARLVSISADLARDWTDHARYMEHPWVVAGLRPLLSRTEVSFSLFADTRPVPIRVCDLAAATALDMMKPAVAFRTGVRRYEASELEKVRQIAQSV